MGAWGGGIYQNDDALDWVAEFEEHGVPVLRQTVMELGLPGDVDAARGARALAACALVAGGSDRHLPEDAPDGLQELANRLSGEISQADDLVPACRAVVRRVLDQGSELAQLWDAAEATDRAAFVKAVGGLSHRLGEGATGFPNIETAAAQMPEIEYRLHPLETVEALAVWIREGLTLLEQGCGRSDGEPSQMPDPADSPVALAAFVEESIARIERMQSQLGLAQNMRAATVDPADDSPGGLRAIHVWFCGPMMQIETKLTGRVH